MIFNFKENKRMRIYKTKKTYFKGRDFLSLGVTLRALRALRLKQGSLLLALLLSLPFWACANVKGGLLQLLPPPPPGLPSLMATGDKHTCAVVRGGMKCWGSSDAGQLGHGSLTRQEVPVDVKGLEPGKNKGVSAVSAGSSHACAVVKGGVKCWGSKGDGRLGYGSSDSHSQSTPLDVKGLEPGTDKGVTAVSAASRDTVGGRERASGSHTCAVVRGGLKCWGNGQHGRLGDGSTTQRNIPVDVKGLEPGTDKGVTALSTGSEHTCAVVQGGLKCWGNGQYGRLGDGLRGVHEQLIPLDVKGLEPGTGKGVTAVSAGNTHTCAVVRGGVKCWGDGDRGQLGNGVSGAHNQLSPLYVKGLGKYRGVSAVSAGDFHTCAVVRGGLKCWGNGQYGRLGDGLERVNNQLSPVNVKGLEPGTGKGVTAVSAGNRHTCAVVKGAVVQGGMKCWGEGQHGALGLMGDGVTSLVRM